MAAPLNFPDPPVTTGTNFLNWTYDGEKWVAKTSGVSVPSIAPPTMNGVASPGSADTYSRGDHVHPTDTSRAPLSSPAFTAVPTAPTAPPGTNTTQIATTAFVNNAIPAGGAFLPIGGGTLSGALVIASASYSTLTINSPVGAGSDLFGQNNAKNRWAMRFGDGSTESGANVGGDFAVIRYADNGTTALGFPLAIKRSTGLITVEGDPTAALGIATKQYVDAHASAGPVAASAVTFTPAGGVGATNVQAAVAELDTEKLKKNGDDTSTGSITATTFNASTNAGFAIPAQNASFASDATFSTLTFNAGLCAFRYNKTTGTLEWLVNGAPPQAQWTLDGNFVVKTKGYQPGGGSWDAISDSRIKNVEGDYTAGLAQVKQLRPIRFTFKGNDGRSASMKDLDDTVPYKSSPHFEVATRQLKYTGLIAQEVETVFPEMVTKLAGFIDGAPVTDLRNLNTTPLIYALVNAVKELSARIEALEALP